MLVTVDSIQRKLISSVQFQNFLPMQNQASYFFHLLQYKVILEEFARTEEVSFPELSFEQVNNLPDSPNPDIDRDLYRLLDFLCFLKDRFPEGFSTILQIEADIRNHYKINKNTSRVLGILGQAIGRFSNRNWRIPGNIGWEGFKIPSYNTWSILKNRILFSNYAIASDPKETKDEYDDRAEFNHLKAVVAYHFFRQYDRLRNLAKIEQNWQSVLIVVDKKHLQEIDGDDNNFILMSQPLKNRKLKKSGKCICSTEAYADQPSANFYGTAFFITEKIIATAAHVVIFPDEPTIKFEDLRFIRGLEISSPLVDDQLKIPKKSIFKPKGGLNDISYWLNSEIDWAILEVEDAFSSHKALPGTPIIGYRNYTKDEAPVELYSAGHGLGLPKKFVFDGIVRKNHPKSYFSCTLDLFSGNSGSPVFDALTHEVIGIMARGERDFQSKGNCVVPIIYSTDSDFFGEQVQRMEPVINALIKKTGRMAKVLTQDRRLIPDNPRKNAPYGYLVREENSANYYIFILVPVNEGSNIGEPTLTESKGTKIFIYNLVENAAIDGYARDRIGPIELNETPENWELEVRVMFNPNDKDVYYKVRFDVENANVESNVPEDIFNDRPYMYLTRMEDVENANYEPFLIIPSLRFNDSQESPASPDVCADSYQDTVVLKPENAEKDGPSTNYIIPPVANTHEYKGKDEEGHYEVIIKNAPGQPESSKKGKVKNRHADTKPSGFEELRVFEI
jgi:V8-like Glu-specific endopeptidase